MNRRPKSSSSSALRRGLLATAINRVSSDTGCSQHHRHTRQCPQRKPRELACVSRYATPKSCEDVDPQLYEGSRNLTPWLNKNPELPSSVMVWLRTNIFVLTWVELLFTLIVTIIWLVLINESVLVFDPAIFSSTALIFIVSFAGFLIALLLNSALSKHDSNTRIGTSLIRATNNLMASLAAGYSEKRFLESKVPVLTHDNCKFVRTELYAHEVLGELSLLLNALLIGQPTAFTGELEVELLPLRTEHIEYLKEYQIADPMLVLQQMVEARINSLIEAQLLVGEIGSFVKLHVNEISGALNQLETNSRIVSPRVINNLVYTLLAVLVLFLPPWYSTVYPGYWPLLWVPLTIVFLFASIRLASRVHNIFVSHSQCIWTGVPLLKLIYDGAATNHEMYIKILEQLEDVRAEPAAVAQEKIPAQSTANGNLLFKSDGQLDNNYLAERSKIFS